VTDRIHSITLVLEQDMRVDDVEDLMIALRCFKRVVLVQPNVSDYMLLVAESRVRRDLEEKLWKVLK